MEPEEYELVEKAKTDAEAFSTLYEKYLPQIFGYVSRRIGDREEVEDLVSNIFLKVVENIGKFNAEKSSFKTWLYTITTNTMIDYFRTRKKTTADIEFMENTMDPNPNPHEHASKQQDQEKVLSVISGLSERHQQILMLKYFSDLGTIELAQALGVTENNVYVLINRALQAFEKHYQRYA